MQRNLFDDDLLGGYLASLLVLASRGARCAAGCARTNYRIFEQSGRCSSLVNWASIARAKSRKHTRNAIGLTEVSGPKGQREHAVTAVQQNLFVFLNF